MKIGKRQRGKKKVSVEILVFSVIALLVAVIISLTLQNTGRQETAGVKITNQSPFRAVPISVASVDKLCRNPVTSFSVLAPCGNGFRYSVYSCQNDYSEKVGDQTSCKPLGSWLTYAQGRCRERARCVSRGSACLRRPNCLNSKPPCLIPEPREGWCISPATSQ